MATSRHCQRRGFHSVGLLLSIATAALATAGCRATAGSHQPIACRDCIHAGHEGPYHQARATAPISSPAADDQTANKFAQIPAPASPTPKAIVRPPLISTKLKPTSPPQTVSRSTPDVTRDTIQSTPIESINVGDQDNHSSSRMNPIADTASTQAVDSNRQMLDSINVSKAFPLIDEIQEQALPLESKMPSALPSNTLIMELDAVDESSPALNDQSQADPDEKIPKLKLLIESDFSSASRLSTNAIPEATLATTPRTMIAVPRLYPSEIPPIVRIVKIADSTIAKAKRRPYSLTTAPHSSEGKVQSIEPVLDNLRTGRPAEPAPVAETIHR